LRGIRSAIEIPLLGCCWARNSALQECLIAGLLCNDSHLEEKNGQWVVVDDPTEGALIASRCWGDL
jgi:magnesium-transporting ATPase (P-type)